MKRLNQVICDVLNIDYDFEKISPKNTESWDSLSHLNLIVALEEMYKIEIPAEDFPLLYSDYNSIINYLNQKI